MTRLYKKECLIREHEAVCLITVVDGLYSKKIEEHELCRCRECKHYAGDGMYCAKNILVPYAYFYCEHNDRKRGNCNG